jgi:hypothetical protein
MERDGLVEGDTIPREQGHSGPSARGYKLAADPQIITWRSTALLLVTLLHHKNRTVEEQRFINEIVDAGGKDETGQPLTSESVGNQLQWCIDKGYVRLEAGSDPSSPMAQRRVSATALVHRELLFLERLIGRKLPVTETEGIPSASGSGDPAVDVPRS